MTKRLWIILGVLTPSLAGCNMLPGLDFLGFRNIPGHTDAASAADQVTRFAVGDRIVLDNPVTRWQVAAIEGDRVQWVSDTGDRQVTGFNPLLPALEWKSRTAGTGQRFIRDVVGSLFPMQVGATMSFRSTVVTSEPPFGWEHNWSCSVTGKQVVQVLVSSYDTFVVGCGREKPGEVIFYYSPKVGYYVVQVTAGADGDAPRTRNLLAYERADGTVLAGLTKGSVPPLPNVDQPPRAGPVPPPSKTVAPAPVKAVPPPGSAPQPPALRRPASLPLPPATKQVNVRPAVGEAAPDLSAAKASVTLGEPEFGGNAKPPPLPAHLTPEPKAVPTPATVPVAAEPLPTPKPVPPPPAPKTT
jgi:hypothetical protein